MRLEFLHSRVEEKPTFIASRDDRLGSPKAKPAENSVPAWPYAGYSLQHSKNRSFYMGVAVLLAYDCQLRVEVVRLFTKQKSIFQIAPHTWLHLLLSETKTGASQSVNFCSKTDKTLLSRRWSSSKNEDDRLFSFFAIISVRESTRLWENNFPWRMSGS